ncbi:MAG: InlB B-repeat-containing protein, partial [Puniceicoccales bacterium]
MKKTFLAVSILLAGATASAQYIDPTYRNGDDDVNFADWRGFDVGYTPESPPYTGLNGSQVNIPFAGGNTTARLGQYAVPGAFITSSFGIYWYGETPTAFKVYDNPEYSPGDILFQTQTLVDSQSIPDVSTVKLYYRTTPGGSWIEADIGLAAAITSTDNDGNLYTAWEWDTSSLVIEDYYIDFAYELSHSSFIGAQLDTHETFDLQIDGFGLSIEANVPADTLFGTLARSPEKIVYNDGEEVVITATASPSFEFVKWVGPFGESTDNPLNVNITADTQIGRA